MSGPLTSEEVFAKARELGVDWSGVSGGPANAVHGALWKECEKGVVRKKKNGPWELVEDEAAPKIDVRTQTATMSASRLPRVLTQRRRQTTLDVLGIGRMSPIEILEQLRTIPDYRALPRHAVREDLDSLIADGKIERTGRGLYKKAV